MNINLLSLVRVVDNGKGHQHHADIIGTGENSEAHLIELMKANKYADGSDAQDIKYFIMPRAVAVEMVAMVNAVRF